jgi:formylglycine-generating enzyme required for sulfatase activity
MMQKAARYYVLRGAAVAVLATVLTLGGLAIWDHVEERNRDDHAAGLVEQLLRADIDQVEGIVTQIDKYRVWADPRLRQEYALASESPPAKLRLSLALLPVDPGQKDYLAARLLQAAPDEVPVLRKALARYKGDLLQTLWAAAAEPAAGQEQPRLRPAAALAQYGPASPRWAEVQAQIADELVAVPANNLATWMTCLQPVSGRLQDPLAVVFRDSGRRPMERERAAVILRDYAAGQPDVLADLLMDADPQQFAVLLSKVAAHGERSAAVLDEELAKRVITGPTVAVLHETDTIRKDSRRVKVEALKDPLPALAYRVSMKAGKTYLITMRSKELNAYLVLHDKNGKQLLYDDDCGGGQDALLIYTAGQDGDYTVYAAALTGTGSFSLTIEEPDAAAETKKETLAKRQSNAAVALLRMNHPEKVWPLLKHSPDPRVRTYIIHRLGPYGADVHAVVKQIDEEQDVTIRRALILSLGEFSPTALSAAVRTALVEKLKDLYQTADDAGVHGAAEWLLRQPTWHEEQWLRQTYEAWAKEKEPKRLSRIKEILGQEKGDAGPQWYVNGQGQTMVVLAGLEPFVMGSPPLEEGRGLFHLDESQHRVRIGRTFAIAAAPVTFAQYVVFDSTYADANRSLFGPQASCPVGYVTWYQAARYCNWLSDKENLPRCYETDADDHVTAVKKDYLSLTGYRLPTEAEWEYACRAHAITTRYYGESRELLAKYGWYIENSAGLSGPVYGKKPNDFGLFDMHGNVCNWCQETIKGYPQGLAGNVFDDTEDSSSIDKAGRVCRGANFYCPSWAARCAHRSGDKPDQSMMYIGFRPARTFR